MPAGYSIVRIESPENTIVFDLAGGDSFIVENGWSPTDTFIDPARRANTSGFIDVRETITLNLTHATLNTLLSNRTKLASLMTQAYRWSVGDNVSPVLLVCQVQGSDVLVKTPILGVSEGSATQTSPSFLDLLPANELEKIQLTFMRNGLWYDQNTFTASHTGRQAVQKATLTFASTTTTPSPCRLSLTSYNGYNNGFIIVGDGANTITTQEITSINNGTVGGGTSVVDAYASGGSYFTYGADNLSSSTSSFYYGRAFSGITPMATSVYRTHAFVSYRVEGTSRWKLYVTPTRWGDKWSGTRHAIVESNASAYPNVISLGVFGTEMTYEPVLWMEIIGSSRSSSDKIHLDYICLVDADKTNVIGLFPISATLFDPTETLFVDPQTFTRPTPRIHYTISSLPYPYPSYRGNLSIHTTQTTVEGILLATQNANWRPQAASTLITNDWSLIRRPAYIGIQ